ncbi:hypothetical protein Aduo_018148 [Ancylostoma duodenale]
MREFMFSGVRCHVVTTEHKRLPLLEQATSEEIHVLIRHFVKLYQPNVYLCTISAALYLTSKRGLWRRLGRTWKVAYLDESFMIPKAALMSMFSRFQRARFTLTGDSEQLSPYIGVHNIPLAVDVNSRSVLNLACRYRNVPVCTVSTVYRPHVEMMRLNSDLFYEGKLICGTPSHMRRALLSRLPMTNPAIAIAFVDVPSQ